MSFVIRSADKLRGQHRFEAVDLSAGLMRSEAATSGLQQRPSETAIGRVASCDE